VWDVVDRLPEDEEDRPVAVLPEDQLAGLPSQGRTQHGSTQLGPLVADHVDVYSGANGVVLMYDAGRPETLEYVKKALLTVPTDLPVLVLGNKRDLDAAKHAVDLRDAEAMAEMACRSRVRATGGRRVQAFEVSLRNCFGLKVLYNYLNLPFLELKVSQQLRELRDLKHELATARDEVATYIEAQDYGAYTAWLAATSAGDVAPEGGTDPLGHSSATSPQHVWRDPAVLSPAMAAGRPAPPRKSSTDTPNEFVQQAEEDHTRRQSVTAASAGQARAAAEAVRDPRADLQAALSSAAQDAGSHSDSSGSRGKKHKKKTKKSKKPKRAGRDSSAAAAPPVAAAAAAASSTMFGVSAGDSASRKPGQTGVQSVDQFAAGDRRQLDGFFSSDEEDTAAVQASAAASLRRAAKKGSKGGRKHAHKSAAQQQYAASSSSSDEAAGPTVVSKALPDLDAALAAELGSSEDEVPAYVAAPVHALVSAPARKAPSAKSSPTLLQSDAPPQEEQAVPDVVAANAAAIGGMFASPQPATVQSRTHSRAPSPVLAAVVEGVSDEPPPDLPPAVPAGFLDSDSDGDGETVTTSTAAAAVPVLVAVSMSSPAEKQTAPEAAGDDGLSDFVPGAAASGSGGTMDSFFDDDDDDDDTEGNGAGAGGGVGGGTVSPTQDDAGSQEDSPTAQASDSSSKSAEGSNSNGSGGPSAAVAAALAAAQVQAEADMAALAKKSKKGKKGKKGKKSK